jgi:hypothetical protein
MRFDTKLAIILRDDLPTWQKLNVTAFLSSGLATLPDMTGEDYEDGSGVRYRPMFRQPVLVFAAEEAAIRQVHEQALAQDLPMALFTADLFATGHDEANRAAVRAVATDALDLVGLGLRGPRKPLDKLLKGLALHP